MLDTHPLPLKPPDPQDYFLTVLLPSSCVLGLVSTPISLPLTIIAVEGWAIPPPTAPPPQSMTGYATVEPVYFLLEVFFSWWGLQVENNEATY